MTRRSGACGAMCVSDVACAWRHAAKWAWRRCACPTHRLIGWPISISNVRRPSVSGVAPACRSARPRQSASRIWTAYAGQSLRGPWCRSSHFWLAANAAPRHGRRPIGISCGIACPITWRPFWTANSAHPALACGHTVRMPRGRLSRAGLRLALFGTQILYLAPTAPRPGGLAPTPVDLWLLGFNHSPAKQSRLHGTPDAWAGRHDQGARYA